MAEFTIDEATYRTTATLDAMTQHKLVKRLGPALASVLTAFRPSSGAVGAPNAIVAIIDNADALMKALSEISDADSDFIILMCLSVVSAKRGDSWSPMGNLSTGLMFEDLKLGVLYNIVGRVLAENLGPFFQEFLSNFLLDPATTESPAA